MRIAAHARFCRLAVFSFALCFLSSLGYSSNIAFAQANCTGEAPQGTFAVPPGSTVYYSVDPSVSAIQTSPNGGNSPQTQINNAFTAWNNANAGPGGDGTQFLPASASNPATVTVTADPSYTGNQGAYIDTPSPGIINSLNPATITLYPNGTLPGGTPAFQPQAAGYNTAYWQVMVHEIGRLAPMHPQ